uniref:Mitoferrin n=1 Tax=Cuerna arida TaxID=1464854 RepID=A0A1B6EHE9_9HEMI
MSESDHMDSVGSEHLGRNMVAGAVAGIMELAVMYPIDTVKTRMQSLSGTTSYRSIGEVLQRMVSQEGILRPVRGMGAVVMGAGPAHALYFSCYEYLKENMTHRGLNNHLAYGVAGSVATVLHDGIMTPADVVKQRIQMYNSPYKNLLDCIIRVYRAEGLLAFYRSYTTQLAMNLPFQSFHFVMYELCQNMWNPERTYNPAMHMASGAIAGGVAAAITTPLDVCKTLLNTQEGTVKVSGLVNAIQAVYKIGGPLGYFRGMSARVLYQMPSTAICWSTYEFFKYMLTTPVAMDSIGETPEAESPPKSRGPAPVSESWPRELPAMSGAGMYGTLSFTTVHTTEGSLDITHS